ncbi:unnamed protein product [Rangifer tarandus platyrhynchus]|uniref:Uncharacterized protein n=2 Tax=Rangifer tarandus platyrhynchus TaxID=3082113 RepID=A0ABN8Y9B2_RANTA|nr:unnamed protein product [Rangifer tarandus platyrhynchus]CAI9696125.1 unnamed protein product [Rangifer tarandus platyrhynchus]
MELSEQEEACMEEQKGGGQWTQPRADGWEIQQAAEERLGVTPTLGGGVPALLGISEEEWAGGEGAIGSYVKKPDRVVRHTPIWRGGRSLRAALSSSEPWGGLPRGQAVPMAASVMGLGASPILRADPSYSLSHVVSRLQAAARDGSRRPGAAAGWSQMHRRARPGWPSVSKPRPCEGEGTTLTFILTCASSIWASPERQEALCNLQAPRRTWRPLESPGEPSIGGAERTTEDRRELGPVCLLPRKQERQFGEPEESTGGQPWCRSGESIYRFSAFNASAEGKMQLLAAGGPPGTLRNVRSKETWSCGPYASTMRTSSPAVWCPARCHMQRWSCKRCLAERLPV